MNRTVRILLGLLTIGLVALTSCKKENQEPKKNEGTTYANVTISIQSDLRAGTDDAAQHNPKGTWNGKDAIKSIAVYIVDNATISSGDYDESKFTITPATDGTNISITPKEAILTTPGKKSVYVLINAAPEIKTYLDAAATPFAFKRAYAAAVDLITAQQAAKTETNGADTQDVIMMTNAKEYEFTIAEGVSQEKAEAAQNPENRCAVEVKRAVARVLLTTTEETYEVKYKNSEEVMGTIKDITYAVAQGEKSFYLMQMRDANNIIKTPAFDFVPEKLADDYKLTADSYTKMGKYYDYSDLIETGKTGGTPRKALKATGLDDALKIGAQSLEQSVFMFEASHKYGKTADDTDFRRANTPYVLVRAKFVPAKFEDAEGNTYTEGSTFYMGENGRFYIKKENVVNEEKGGVKDQKYYTYENAKVIYYAFVNPDVVGKTINAPAYRNNIYHISVKGFKTIGMTWNPLFPEDPDTTDPKNPDPKPKDDPVPPITPGETNTPKETYMSVEVSVIPWNVHTYDIELSI